MGRNGSFPNQGGRALNDFTSWKSVSKGLAGLFEGIKQVNKGSHEIRVIHENNIAADARGNYNSFINSLTSIKGTIGGQRGRDIDGIITAKLKELSHKGGEKIDSGTLTKFLESLGKKIEEKSVGATGGDAVHLSILSKAVADAVKSVGKDGFAGFGKGAREIGKSAFGFQDGKVVGDAAKALGDSVFNTAKTLSDPTLRDSVTRVETEFKKIADSAATVQDKLNSLSKLEGVINALKGSARGADKDKMEELSSTVAGKIQESSKSLNETQNLRGGAKWASRLDTISRAVGSAVSIVPQVRKIVDVANSSFQAINSRVNQFARMQMQISSERGHFGRQLRGAGINYGSMMTALASGRSAGMSDQSVVNQMVDLQTQLAQARWGEGGLIEKAGRWGISVYDGMGRTKSNDEMMLEYSRKLRTMNDPSEKLQFLTHMGFRPEQMEYVANYEANHQRSMFLKANPHMQGVLDRADILDQNGTQAKIDAATKTELRRREILNQNAIDQGIIPGLLRSLHPENWLFNDWTARQKGVEIANGQMVEQKMLTELQKIATATEKGGKGGSGGLLEGMTVSDFFAYAAGVSAQVEQDAAEGTNFASSLQNAFELSTGISSDSRSNLDKIIDSLGASLNKLADGISSVGSFIAKYPAPAFAAALGIAIASTYGFIKALTAATIKLGQLAGQGFAKGMGKGSGGESSGGIVTAPTGGTGGTTKPAPNPAGKGGFFKRIGKRGGKLLKNKWVAGAAIAGTAIYGGYKWLTGKGEDEIEGGLGDSSNTPGGEGQEALDLSVSKETTKSDIGKRGGTENSISVGNKVVGGVSPSPSSSASKSNRPLPPHLTRKPTAPDKDKMGSVGWAYFKGLITGGAEGFGKGLGEGVYKTADGLTMGLVLPETDMFSLGYEDDLTQMGHMAASVGGYSLSSAGFGQVGTAVKTVKGIRAAKAAKTAYNAQVAEAQVAGTIKAGNAIKKYEATRAPLSRAAKDKFTQKKIAEEISKIKPVETPVAKPTGVLGKTINGGLLGAGAVAAIDMSTTDNSHNANVVSQDDALSNLRGMIEKGDIEGAQKYAKEHNLDIPTEVLQSEKFLEDDKEAKDVLNLGGYRHMSKIASSRYGKAIDINQVRQKITDKYAVAWEKAGQKMTNDELIQTAGRQVAGAKDVSARMLDNYIRNGSRLDPGYQNKLYSKLASIGKANPGMSLADQEELANKEIDKEFIENLSHKDLFMYGSMGGQIQDVEAQKARVRALYLQHGIKKDFDPAKDPTKVQTAPLERPKPAYKPLWEEESLTPEQKALEDRLKKEGDADLAALHARQKQRTIAEQSQIRRMAEAKKHGMSDEELKSQYGEQSFAEFQKASAAGELEKIAKEAVIGDPSTIPLGGGEETSKAKPSPTPKPKDNRLSNAEYESKLQQEYQDWVKAQDEPDPWGVRPRDMMSATEYLKVHGAEAAAAASSMEANSNAAESAAASGMAAQSGAGQKVQTTNNSNVEINPTINITVTGKAEAEEIGNTVEEQLNKWGNDFAATVYNSFTTKGL